MLRNACFWKVFAARWPLLRGPKPPRCDIERNSERRAAGTNAAMFWNAVADNSIVVVGGKPPQAGSAETAIVQTAVYDAVNAICGFHLPRMP